MTAQQLRNSILQQAIQGRLVPQDPNDEPANVLLENIRKEKEQLVKEGKLKKKDLIVTPITDEEKPFDIPSGWEWCRLGYISSYAAPKKKINATAAEYTTWGLDLEDIEKGGRLLHKISIAERKAIGDKTIFSKGNILYSKLRPYLLKVLIAPDNGICTQEIIPFNCYGQIDHEYIVYLLKSPYVDEYINNASYGVKMPRVGTETMISLPLPLPPLAEQKRIVAKIEELMPLVEKYGKAQSELDNLNASLPSRLRQSILQEAIQGKLVPLGEVAKIVTGSTPSKVNNNYYGLDYPFFKPGDLTHQYINKSVDGLSCLGFEAARKLPPNTILVCCIGSLGKCSIIETEGSCNQQINAILPSESYDTKYLYYVIQSPNFIEQMWEKATSTTVTLLNKNKFSEIPIPLPPLAEQRRIVAKIEELFAEIDKLK